MTIKFRHIDNKTNRHTNRPTAVNIVRILITLNTNKYVTEQNEMAYSPHIFIDKITQNNGPSVDPRYFS